MENSVNSNFNDTTSGVGIFQNLTTITSNDDPDIDKLIFNIGGKPIEGKKIRLKYLYIKGYIMVSGSSATTTNNPNGTMNINDAVDDNFNCKLMVFRWKRNTTNYTLNWTTLMNGITSNSPANWTTADILNMMYRYDWKNDITINFL